MEKSVIEESTLEERGTSDFFDCMEEVFSLKAPDDAEIEQYSPLTLAYIGDCIFDLIIKTLVVRKGNRQVHKLHLESSRYVQASAQSEMMRSMQACLREEEHAVYKRGRNAKSVSPARNQSITDYRRATGFEAVLGYLYLKKEWKRLLELVKTGLDSLEEMDLYEKERTDSEDGK